MHMHMQERWWRWGRAHVAGGACAPAPRAGGVAGGASGESVVGAWATALDAGVNGEGRSAVAVIGVVAVASACAAASGAAGESDGASGAMATGVWKAAPRAGGVANGANGESMGAGVAASGAGVSGEVSGGVAVVGAVAVIGANAAAVGVAGVCDDHEEAAQHHAGKWAATRMWQATGDVCVAGTHVRGR